MGVCCNENSDKSREFKTIAETPEQAARSKQVDEIWAKYDADGSGVLEKDEAMKFLRDINMEIFGAETTDEQNEATFKMIDENGNGSFEKDELKKHIAGLEGEADCD